MIRVRVGAGGAVRCRAQLDAPLAAKAVWGLVRDFQRFARHDFFHAEIELAGGVPRSGAALRMTHRFAMFRVERTGKILRWQEGIGFSYSDLSQRGSRHGFPHVFSYRIEPTSPRRCRLHIRVSGRWTAPLIPRFLAALWLRWVFTHIVINVRNELLMSQIWRKRRERSESEGH